MSQCYFAGIDLGTMHTAVVGSNGVRHFIPSMVGVPRDELARSFLKRDMVFGEELDTYNNMLFIHRPFERGTLKYGESHLDSEAYAEYAKALLKYAVDMLEFPASAEVRCILGVPAQASMQNKQAIMEIASVLGQAVLLVSEPFALAFCRESQRSEAMIVDVGAGTTDICHFYGAFPNPEDQLTLGYGGDHLDFELRQNILDAFPEVQLSIAATRRLKERYGFVGSPTEAITVQLPVRGSTPKSYDLTEILEHTCSRLANQIVVGIKELIAKIDYERHENLLKGILLAGGGSQLRGLDKHIERELRHLGEVQVTRLYDSVFAGAQGALNLALRLPENCWESLLQANS